MMMLVIVGGVLVHRRRGRSTRSSGPNPLPGVFGFHEIFHACTVLAFLCHWTAILLIVMDPVVRSALSRPLRRLARRPLRRRAARWISRAVAHAAGAAHHVDDQQDRRDRHESDDDEAPDARRHEVRVDVGGRDRGGRRALRGTTARRRPFHRRFRGNRIAWIQRNRPEVSRDVRRPRRALRPHAGAPRAPRGGGAIVAAVAVALVVVAWVVVGRTVRPRRLARRAATSGYALLGDRRGRGRATRSRSPPGIGGSCALRRSTRSSRSIGWKVVDVPAVGADARAASRDTVRTSEPAVTGLIYRCWLT